MDHFNRLCAQRIHAVAQTCTTFEELVAQSTICATWQGGEADIRRILAEVRAERGVDA